MNISPKSLQVLNDLKAELLSRKIHIEPPPDPILEMLEEVKAETKREKKPTQFMRHAKLHGESWQRYHRRGGW